MVVNVIVFAVDDHLLGSIRVAEAEYHVSLVLN
jgi:hypothetical protein